MKALKAFIKLFEAPQRSVKIKTSVNFYFNANFLNSRERMVKMFQFQDEMIQTDAGNLIVSIWVLCFSQNIKESAILLDSFCSGISLTRFFSRNKKLDSVHIFLFKVNNTSTKKGVKYDVILFVFLLLTSNK